MNRREDPHFAEVEEVKRASAFLPVESPAFELETLEIAVGQIVPSGSRDPTRIEQVGAESP